MIGSLCTGYGGLDLAVEALTGQATAWVCEYDKHPSTILGQRFPGVPNLHDLTAVDWARVEPVDILTAGYPCQPFSHAGKRKGTTDERHLWPYIADAIRVLRPRLVCLENVAGHLSLGFGDVLGDLAALGYDARWGVVRAADAGAPHNRARVFILATDTDSGTRGQPEPEHLGAGRSAGQKSAQYGPGLATDTRGGPLTRPTPTRHGLPITAERGSRTPPNPGGERHGGEQDTAGVGRLDGEDAGTPERGATTPDTESHEQRERPVAGMAQPGDGTGAVNHQGAWGAYAPAIRRWEHILGRPAPAPTEPGRNGPRLAPLFVEFLMGLPTGWVTDTGIPRNAQLKALGNGVVPQQAALALTMLGLTCERAAA